MHHSCAAEHQMNMDLVNDKAMNIENPAPFVEKLCLQVQPQFFRHEEWMALSLREGLFFEPLEFFLPPAIGDAEEYHLLREWYKNSGRVTSLHGAFIDVNPASSDPAFSDLSRKRCHESCSIAKQLGAKQIVFHASAHPFLRGQYLDTWAGRSADFYSELAETYGLGIRIENSQDMDSTPLLKLMQRIRNSDVAVCLDVGHAHYSFDAVEKWFDVLGEYIQYLHLSDNLGSFDDHLPIGAGSINWEILNGLWKNLGRNMPITLEVGGIAGVEESLRFLRENGYFGIGG